MTTDAAAIAVQLEELDPETRRRAAQRIGQLAGPEAVTLLVRALGDADWRVRKEAAAVAGAVEPRAHVLELLFHALNDRENVGLRNAAVEALIALGRDAVPGAIRALDTADGDARKLIVETLGGAPDLLGTQALTRALEDEDLNVRVAATEALGTAALAGEEAQTLAIVALTAVLSVTAPLQTLAALNALDRLEARLTWEVLEPLASDPLLRRHAIAAAGRSHEAASVGALARAIGDRSVAVAEGAMVALVDCLAAEAEREELRDVARRELQTSPAAEARIRTFAGCDDDARVRGAALGLLGLLRVPSDVPELVRGLSDEGVCEQAELGLRWFGQSAVPALLTEEEMLRRHFVLRL